MDHELPLRVPGDSPRARRRWTAVVAAALLIVVVGAASADGAVRTTPGANAGDIHIRPAYQGRFVTSADVAGLQELGLARTSVLNRELVCQGIELYFDTTDQRDAYVADYLSRFPAEPPYLTGDPCRPYRDSPRLVAQE